MINLYDMPKPSMRAFHMLNMLSETEAAVSLSGGSGALSGSPAVPAGVGSSARSGSGVPMGSTSVNSGSFSWIARAPWISSARSLSSNTTLRKRRNRAP